MPGTSQGQGCARFILRSSFHRNMASANSVESITHGLKGDFRPIAISTKMSQIQVTEFGRRNFHSRICCGTVGKVAMAAQDTLLYAPRATGVLVQEFKIMIRLKH